MTRLRYSITLVLLLWLAALTGSSVTTATAVAESFPYFDALVARGDLWKAYSLRDAAQLQSRNNGGYAGNGSPLAVTYDPANDPDPRRQDAAKVVIPATLNSLPNQVRLPLGTQDGRSYLITWEAWYGAEFRYANTGIPNYKTFQFDSPRRLNADGSVDLGSANIWFEINNRWNNAPNDAGVIGGRYYATASTPYGPGTTIEPLSPQLDNFTIKAQTWTRYWVLLEQKVNGDSWTRASLWIADPGRGPVQIFNRLAFTVLGGVDRFWLEFNTSTEPVAPGRGPLVAYVRNVVMLRDAPNPTSLMQRPGASGPLPPGAPRNLRIIPPALP
jgi:hypothetical protein